MHRSGINVELLWPHSIYKCCSHIHIKCKFCSLRSATSTSRVQPPHLPSFTTNLLMLKTVLRKICRLRDYCDILCRQMDYCVTKYGFRVDFVTRVQCALKSHVSPRCTDGIEFKNSNQTSTYR